MIIDGHAHASGVFFEKDTLVSELDRLGVDKAALAPMGFLADDSYSQGNIEKAFREDGKTGIKHGERECSEKCGKNAQFDQAAPEQPNHLRLQIVNKLGRSTKIGGGWSYLPFCLQRSLIFYPVQIYWSQHLLESQSNC
jgi:hypothetical protein